MATSGKRLLNWYRILYTTTLEVFKSICITSWWFFTTHLKHIRQILGLLSLMVGSILYDFTSWSCHAAAKQAPSHWWNRCYHCGRRPCRAWGGKYQWRMHVDIECSRLHAWSRVVADNFGQSSIQAGPSVGCVPYFKACAEWKFETTRTWGSTGTGGGYLHPRQFACCCVFCPRRRRWGWRVLFEWDYRTDRG